MRTCHFFCPPCLPAVPLFKFVLREFPSRSRAQLLTEERLDFPAMLARVAFDAQQACERNCDRRGAMKWMRVVRENTKLSSKVE